MPKDYQTSQYDEPITIDGWLDIDGVRVGITRAHLEEDTGKSQHVGVGGRIHDADYSLVDYNRAGVPLLEIVSEPDIRSAEQAKRYVEELRATLLAVGVSDVKMEEGSLRIDANVSVRAPGATEFGTRGRDQEPQLVAFARARDRVRGRTAVGADAGGREGRAGDAPLGRGAAAARSRVRSKEEAHDYRYFPEPDLVPVAADAGDARRGARVDARAAGGAARALRRASGGSATRTRACSSTCPGLADYAGARGRGAGDGGGTPKDVVNWVRQEVLGVPERDRACRPRCSSPEMLAELVGLVADGHDLAPAGEGRARRVAARGEVAAHDRRGARARAGERRGRDRARSSTGCSPRTPASSTSTAPATTRRKKKKRGFLMGQVMRELKGQGNAQVINRSSTSA